MNDNPTIPCELCGTPTPMLGTKRCDPCWELEGRIHKNPGLARVILERCDPDYKLAIQRLYEWQHGGSNSFSSKVFLLCGSADMSNINRIAVAWPWLYAAWRDWHNAPSSDDFFRRHGFTIRS